MWCGGEPCEMHEGVEEEDALLRCLCRRLPTLLQQHRENLSQEKVWGIAHAPAITLQVQVQSLMSITNREQILRVYVDDYFTVTIGFAFSKIPVEYDLLYSYINHSGFT